MSVDDVQQQPAQDPEIARLNAKWSAHSHCSLTRRIEDLGVDKYLIEGLIPDRSLSLLVGDSGLGKSPFVYQIAVCVAASLPFLDRSVEQGRVLCLDFENGLAQVKDMVDGISAHLGLSAAPDDLVLWNLNDCGAEYGKPGTTWMDMILDYKPRLIIVDALTGMFPEIEEKNSNAVKAFKAFRRPMRTIGCSIVALHHIRKPSNDPRYAPECLEDIGNPRDWFLQTRGARALINNSDIRLGIDTISIGSSASLEGIALVLRGFARVRGEIPRMYLERVCDDNGEPMAYKAVTGAKLLFNQDREQSFAKLPDTFTFKVARLTFGKGAQATTDFLRACIGLGLMRKVGKTYEKLKVAD